MPQHPLNISIEPVSSNIINFVAFQNAANNNLMRFPSRLTQSQPRRGKHKAKTYSPDTKESLRAKVATLQQELILVKQEKAELENLLKQQEAAKKLQLQEMQIEIDLTKLAHQVAEITQTDYFKQLQIEVEYLRNSDV